MGRGWFQWNQCEKVSHSAWFGDPWLHLFWGITAVPISKQEKFSVFFICGALIVHLFLIEVFVMNVLETSLSEKVSLNWLWWVLHKIFQLFPYILYGTVSDKRQKSGNFQNLNIFIFYVTVSVWFGSNFFYHKDNIEEQTD